MADPIRILGIAGSVRKDSFNRAALRAAQQLVPQDATLEVFELDASVPGFDQDAEQSPPPGIVRLKEALGRSDAVLFVTPEYNYSIPGILKNSIDWASRPYGQSAWAGKTAAIMGASVGALGTARAQYHLRQVLVFLNMQAVLQPEVMIATAGQRFDDQGNLADDKTRQLIGQLLQSLVTLTRQTKAVAAA